MSQSGQYNYKGINSQAWAALSLFLQFLRDPKFSHIHLEAERFEDFNLVFADGKTIICESKDRSRRFSYPDLKQVLDNVIGKHSVGPEDEILVVCTNVNPNLLSNVRNAKYFEPLKNTFARKGYTHESITLLEKVKFWVVPASFNEQVIYSLLAELIDFWLPPEDIQRFVDSLLVQRIYKGSARGTTYSRAEILRDIDAFKSEIQQGSDYFNAKVRKEKQFRELEKIVRSNGRIPWGQRSISTFSTRWDLMSFAMDRLKTRNDLDLKKWTDLWQLNRVYYFAFGIFDVFGKNLHSERNKHYVLQYIKKHTKDIRGFYRTDFFYSDVVRVITNIVEATTGHRYYTKAFDVIRDLITFNAQELFYLKNGSDRRQWETGEICKLLHKIYKGANSALKNNIFNLLVSAFNITEDEGEFSHYAPKELYDIVREWLDEDFAGRFPRLVTILANQYNRFYKKFGRRFRFEGWEHIGGGTSVAAGNYYVGDRHFLQFVLAPALRRFYDRDNDKGWRFIKTTCISSTASVSKVKPDFLNRAVCNILLSRYAAQTVNVSDEAFVILKEFILSRKGIPHKADLIYQSLTKSNVPNDKKWRLVELTIGRYHLPVNPFAEKIVVDLAKQGHQGARRELKKWFADATYYRRSVFGPDAVSSIRALLDTDLEFAVELFQTLITSDYVASTKSDHFGAYDIAVLLHDIVQRDYEKGLSIIRSLEEQNELSVDQQIIYSYGIFNHRGGDDSDDAELLTRVYNDIVDPFLNKNGNDITQISARLSRANCREGFVQFACRLATKKKIAEAVRVIRVFLEDPDPYLPGDDPEDPEDKYNQHKRIENGEEPRTITSVRGWCGWAFMKCSVLEGRSQIPELIEMLRTLTSDRNYYVVHLAALALAQLARNRLSVLPNNRDVLFFDDDRVKALRMAKNVESVAFDIFERLLSWPFPVQKALARSILQVFDPIRALNEHDSLRLIVDLTKLPNDAVIEAAPLFVYYAEFRKDAYKNWRLGVPGLYDDLGSDKYDSAPFKEILLAVITKLQQEDPDSCFRFAASFEHIVREGKGDDIDRFIKVAFEYLDLLTNAYGHNVFNLVYQIIESKFEKPDDYLPDWFRLLVKCLIVEKDFYEKESKAGNIARINWYPTLYHSKILELVHEKLGQDKFMEAAEIFFGFPKDIQLGETSGLVSIVVEIAKTNKTAKKILAYLRDKNPSKYWDLKASE